MKMEFSEIRFCLTIREAQSLMDILGRVKHSNYRFDRAKGTPVSDGIKNDCDMIFHDLDRLLMSQAPRQEKK